MPEEGKTDRLADSRLELPGEDPLGESLIYSKFLGRTLSERARDMGRARLRLIGLTDELATMRLLLCQSLETYSRLLDDPPAGLEPRQLAALRELACSNVMERLERVQDMAVAAHKIFSREALDPVTAQTLVFQITKIVDSELHAAAPQLAAGGLDARQLVDRLQTKLLEVRPPDPKADGQLGTMLTPEALDSEVREMFGTVPYSPPGASVRPDPRTEGANGHVA